MKITSISIKPYANYVIALSGKPFVPFFGAYWSAVASVQGKGKIPAIMDFVSSGRTVVSDFWSDHTVITAELKRIKTAYQSEQNLRKRSAMYPKFQELMEAWGNHDNQIILDYGCGPGNDMVGFLTHTNAKGVIGMDVSKKALTFAANRMALHRVALDRVSLVLISDQQSQALPLPDSSVDYVHCEGVLQHTTDPESILKEFHRVMKPGTTARIMVYNRSSIWYHLYVAYYCCILKRKYAGMTTDQAFALTTDTEQCPLARCYSPEEFGGMCEKAGFQCEYLGGYFSLLELDMFRMYIKQAISDNRLGEDHRLFLDALCVADEKYPLFDGKYAGVGGVFKLSK